MSKLNELTEVGRFRQKVEALLQDLESHHEDARIFEAKRTVAEQREKVRKGFSKTMKSEHLPDSTGKARAADVADEHKGWNASKRFWFLVGASARARGLGWGGLFGLSKGRKLTVLRAIQTLRAAKWPNSHEAYQTAIGWDPAHVQQTNNWPAD